MSSPFRDAAAVTLDASHRVGQAHVPGAALNGRFHPPTAVKGLVARPRLHRKLTASTATKGSGPGPVGLLSAPAGAGRPYFWPIGLANIPEPPLMLRWPG